MVGSNIFTLFFVLGASAAVGPLPVAAGANVDFAAIVVASLLVMLTYGLYLGYLVLYR